MFQRVEDILAAVYVYKVGRGGWLLLRQQNQLDSKVGETIFIKITSELKRVYIFYVFKTWALAIINDAPVINFLTFM